MKTLSLILQLDVENDGRHIAEVVELPGVCVYGATESAAIGAALRLAADVIEFDRRPTPQSLGEAVRAVLK